MHYIGSKAKLSEFLIFHIKDRVGEDLSGMIFCDLFAGSGVISRVIKNQVKKMIGNDLEYYSYVLNYHFVKSTADIKTYDPYIQKLNNLSLGENGFVYLNYTQIAGRNYFSEENAKRIDAMRLQIEEWFTCKAIDRDGYFFLLASLLRSADRVANTASLYGAYLKKLKKTAQQPLVLRSLPNEPSANEHELHNKDANELIKEIQGDILYLDPPYNHRQYGANYHILNTIARYDSFEPKGKTGIREYVSSSYCKKTEVYEKFEALIKEAKFKYIFMSYNDEGLMSEDEIRNIMSKYGRYFFVKKEHQRFKSHKKYKPKTFEHLHILVKEEI